MRVSMAFVASAFLVGGCADPILGASCRDGFEERDGRCVAVGMVDAGPADAGDLDDGDVPGDAPLDAGPPMDGGPSDGDVPGDGDVPADGAPGDGGGGDGGAPACDVGELECDGVCVRPDVDPMHCGGCGMSCASGEVCAGGTCEPACDPPFTMCAGVCVDTDTDPDHCGSCGNSCPSGICVDGECQSATAGHLVVVGHDYRDSRRGMNRVAGNALFLASGAPVEALVFEGAAAASAVRGTDRAFDQVARETGRSWTRSLVTDAREVPLRLAAADAFVVYAQRGGTDAVLRKLGDDWSVALTTFLMRGGVVVVFDGDAMHEGTWQIVDEAGLFTCSGNVEISGDPIGVVSPGDAVALGVPLSYRAETTSVWFETMETRVVVSHADGPVVVHEVFAP